MVRIYDTQCIWLGYSQILIHMELSRIICNKCNISIFDNEISSPLDRAGQAWHGQSFHDTRPFITHVVAHLASD